MEDFGIAAWFQLADCNQFTFSNTLHNDIVIRTTNDNQRILIGPTPCNSSLPSIVTISNSNVSIVGDTDIIGNVIFRENGFIKSVSPGNSLKIEDVGFCNNSINVNDVTVNDSININGPMNASSITVNGTKFITNDGTFLTENIPNLSLHERKIIDDTISENKIKPGTLTSESLSNEGILSKSIAQGNITTYNLSNESITTDKYALKSITNSKIDDDSIQTRNYFPESIDTNALSNNSVTSEKLDHNLNLLGKTSAKGNLFVNIDKSYTDPSSLNILKDIKIIDENDNNIFLESKNSKLGLLRSPNYTFDVLGDINFEGKLFNKGNEWIDTQWYSTQNPYDNCNLVYTNGYVGINKETPVKELDINGSVNLHSNIYFTNYYTENKSIEKPFLTSDNSNIGISITPNATLDVGGNIASKNIIVMDDSQNMFNLQTVNINSNIGINKNYDPNSFFNLDVNGNSRFNATQLLFNDYHMFISSKGNLDNEIDGTYYEIAVLQPDDLTFDNQGCVVIYGDISKQQTSSHIHITLRTNKNDNAPFNVTRIEGNLPEEIIGFTDIQLWRDNNNISFPKYYIYLRTTSNSQFNLQLQGGSIIKTLHYDWNLRKFNTDPSQISSKQFVKVKSLLTESSASVIKYGGKTIHGNDVDILGSVLITSTLSNYDNIATKGTTIEAKDDSINDVMLNIKRYDNNIDISANSYLINGDTWYTNKGDKGNIQVSMKTAENANGKDAFVMFNSFKPIYQDNAGMGWCNWVTFKDYKVGINEQTDPKESIDANGAMILRDGQLLFNGQRSNNIIQSFNNNLSTHDEQTIIWGKSDTTNSNAVAKYYQENDLNKLLFGFKNNNILTLTTENNFGINVDNPTCSLELEGDIKANNSSFTLTNQNDTFHKVFSFSRKYENLTGSNSRYDKLAVIKTSQFQNYENIGTVYLNGTLIHETVNMSCRLVLFFNSQRKNECSTNMECVLLEDVNLLDSLVDIIGYVDNNYNIHLYIKCRSSSLLYAALDFEIAQQTGNGISTFQDTYFDNVPFTNTNYPIANVDNSIEKNIRFFFNTQNEKKRIIRSKNGFVGIGIEYPENQLDVKNITSTGSLELKTGQIRSTENSDGIILNNTLLVDPSGIFVTKNIPNQSIDHSKFTLENQSIMWTNTLSNLSIMNIHPSSNYVGIFSDNDNNAPIDLGAMVSITSNNNSIVYLNTSDSNGLGINKIPKFTLDVNGNINMNGTIYQNDIVWRTTPFTNTPDSIYTPSNVVLGFDNINNDSETLCINTNLSLSNSSGKGIITSCNSFFGFNNNNPKYTIDIDGDFGILGTQLFNKQHDLLNLNTITSKIAKISQSNVGINNFTPKYTIDIDGDIHLTGNIYKNDYYWNEYRNQWVGSNMGISYYSNVGIGTEIPTDETVSIYEYMSLSNNNGKINVYVTPDANQLNINKQINIPFVSLSNYNGFTKLKTADSNLGIYMDYNNNFIDPKCTLDVNGNIGISGTEIIKNNLSMSNIDQITSSIVTITHSNMGINNRYPKDTLAINGSIGFDNENIRLKVKDNYLTTIGKGFVSSNIIINPVQNDTGLIVNTNDEHGIIVQGNNSSILTKSTESNYSVFHEFNDGNNNSTKIGFDGLNFNGSNSESINTFSISTSNNDLRFMTSGEERARFEKTGNLGISTIYPMHTLDVAGNGIGIAGDKFVDINKDVFARSIYVDDIIKVGNLSPNVTSLINYSNIDLILTSSSGGVRSTNKSSPGFATLSNTVYNSVKGSTVIVWNSNMFFSGTDNQGNDTYHNFAYQPVSKNISLPGNSNVNVDLYKLNESNIINIIGNSKVAGNDFEIINPQGNSGETSLRVRNWDSSDIYNTASNTNLHYFEFKLKNNEYNPSIAAINSDKNIEIGINDDAYIRFSESIPHTFIPNTKTFGINLLSGGGTKTVYADSTGTLTNNSSDIRMKDNISALSNNTIDKISKLKPVKFNWNKKYKDPITKNIIDLTKTKGKQKEIGMIAQEVRPIFPECVGMNNDGTLFLEYNKMIPYLVKSIQELNKKNNELENKINNIVSLI